MMPLPEAEPRFNILFSGDIASDVATLYRSIDEYGDALGIVIDIDPNAVVGLVHTITQQFPWPAGHQESSVFKKAGAFTVNFIAQKPIKTSFPYQFAELATCPNEIFAYDFSVAALHNAEVICKDRGKLILEKRIEVSHHFWRDFIAALAKRNIPDMHYRHVALIYEALAYQMNPNVSYERVI